MKLHFSPISSFTPGKEMAFKFSFESTDVISMIKWATADRPSLGQEDRFGTRITVPTERSGGGISILWFSIGHKEFTQLLVGYISWVTDGSLTLTMT